MSLSLTARLYAMTLKKLHIRYSVTFFLHCDKVIEKIVKMDGLFIDWLLLHLKVGSGID